MPAGGATWRVDLVTAWARVGAGAWQGFDATPSSMSVSGRFGAYQPFTAGNSLVLQGTTAETITVEIGFDVRAFSDSNVIFPIRSGDEASVRFGANDTIANGVTAGEYPGVGNRDILTDGHVTTITVSSVP